MNGDRGSGPSRDEESREPFGIDRLTLRFRDPQLEAAYRTDTYRHNLGNIRFAFLGGVVLWVTWGVVLYPEVMAELLGDRFEFGPQVVLDLKGKGPTPVRFLVARRSELPAPTP